MSRKNSKPFQKKSTPSTPPTDKQSQPPSDAVNALSGEPIREEARPAEAPTPGRIVLYVLSDTDADEINRRRTDGNSIADRIESEKWPIGAQAHIGNWVEAGQVLPAVALRAFGEGEGAAVNLKVLLDGPDDFWATSRVLDAGKANGTWHWPERAPMPMVTLEATEDHVDHGVGDTGRRLLELIREGMDHVLRITGHVKPPEIVRWEEELNRLGDPEPEHEPESESESESVDAEAEASAR